MCSSKANIKADFGLKCLSFFLGFRAKLIFQRTRVGPYGLPTTGHSKLKTTKPGRNVTLGAHEKKPHADRCNPCRIPEEVRSPPEFGKSGGNAAKSSVEMCWESFILYHFRDREALLFMH